VGRVREYFFFDKLITKFRYYVDGLHLPIINGANEGIVIVIGMFIATGIFGMFEQ